MQTPRNPVAELETEGAACVVQDIGERAFQSSLLSLNLFLEAALRGSDASSLPTAQEAGRLAARCADAAAEAALIVEDPAKSASAGPAKGLAGGRLRHIHQRTRVAADLVCEIAVTVAPRREQRVGVKKDTE